MSNASKYPDEHLPKIRKNRGRWGVVAFIVLVSFFVMWTLKNYGTPANPGMPDPMVNPPTAPASP